MDFLKKFDGRKIPWWLIALAFLVMSPVGLALLLLKLLAGERQSTAVNEPSLQQWAPMQLPVEKVDTRINKPKYADASDTSRHITIPANPKKVKTGGRKVLGVVLFLIGALTITGELSDIITSLAFLLGGAALGVNAFLTDKEQKRFAAYLPIIGKREAMDVEELARKSGVDEKKVLKDLQKMLEQNYFGGDAYLNRELGYLFKSSEADEAWREQHPIPVDPTPAEVSEGYSGILRDIRRANDQIADPVLSAKIDQLENIVGRILRAMEEDPEKAKRMDTFMTYYLPTTQTLLDSYARFEAAGVEGDNLRESKQRISATMDMILKGFSHQLDELYKTDAMDINSDIRVMETMLKRDAGSVSDDFGLGGSAVQKAPWETK